MIEKRLFKIIVIGMLLIVFSGCSDKKDIVLPLSDEIIQEALEYGQKNAKLTYSEFVKDWTINYGYEKGTGRAVIMTPFLRIALIGRRSAELKTKANRKIISIALEDNIGLLCFQAFIYGEEPNFGSELMFVLRRGDHTIKSAFLYVDPNTEMTRDYYNMAKAEVKFKKDGIAGDAVVTLVVTFPKDDDGKEHYPPAEFPFDLAKYQ